MSTRNYKTCIQSVSNQHPNPPVDFLDTLIDTINALPDDVFARNDKYDIYSVMNNVLGPYTDLLHRKAVMCEVLRVVAAFESDWRWNCGRDPNNQYAATHKEAEETGTFQVSYDSMGHDASLKNCLDRLTGKHDVDTFIDSMKTNHALAVEYCARLFRFNVSWCGTVKNESKVIAHVRRDAVQEFKGFLSLQAPEKVKGEEVMTGTTNNDAACIHTLVERAFDTSAFSDARNRAAIKLLEYAGDKYPTNGCAITLSIMLQDAGIMVKDLYMAIDLTNVLRDKRKWKVIPVGSQQVGDIGTTCGDKPNHGYDHIYLVLERIDNDKMLIADNQEKKPHFRWASGKGNKTPTKYFLRAV